MAHRIQITDLQDIAGGRGKKIPRGRLGELENDGYITLDHEKQPTITDSGYRAMDRNH